MLLALFAFKAAVVRVPLTFMPSSTCMAVDSDEEILLVMNVLAVSVPDIFMPSSTCMAVDSDEAILLVTNVLAVRVPLTFNPSLTCIAVESAELMLFNSTSDENVFCPVIVCAGDIKTVSDVAAPADVLNRDTLNAFTVVLDPEVEAADNVTVVPDSAAVKVN